VNFLGHFLALHLPRRVLGKSVDDQMASQAMTLMSAQGLAGYDVKNPWTARPTMKSESPDSAF